MKFLNLHTYNRLFALPAILCMLFSLSACRDDLLYDPSYIGEGEADVNAELTLFEVVGNLDTRADEENPVTGGTPGNAIGKINQLVVLLYDLQGNLLKSLTGDDFENMKDSENKVTSSDAIPTESEGNDPHPAESITVTKKFTLKKIPYGRYHMYAVANMPRREGGYDDAIQTEEGLKKILLSWNNDVAENNEMFGYFTKENKSSGFGPEEIIINNKTVSLHAWMKRVVSKVTVAFDGSKLKDGVEIFIRSVEIRDIPKTVYLGANNTVESNDNLQDASQIMTYGGDGTDYNPENWVGYVSRSHPINGFNQSVLTDTKFTTDEAKLAAMHTESTNAFFFFENLQGKGREGTMSDKRQQVLSSHEELKQVSFPNGSDPNDPAWKDTKQYGTYIVVRAYYKSGNEKEGEGEILYRFMLGKDVKLDYDAERNYHYKLTLCFNGWADDVDWHIDYRKNSESNKVRVPNPFYISYLYGQAGMLPLEIDADKATTIDEIKVSIISNNWAPADASEFGANIAQGYSQMWDYNNDYFLYLQNMDNPTSYPYNGFLSVRKPENLIRVPSPTQPNGDVILSLNSNEAHYLETNQNERTYNAEELKISEDFAVYEAKTEDKAHVAWEDGTYYVKLPIWTRARQLISQTGYTGNNPYFSYFREAKINISIKLSNGQTITELISPKGEVSPELTVQQVRRVVNPKGVWRSGIGEDGTAPFHVVLKTLMNENDNNFQPIQSDGPWRAYILQCTDATDEKLSNGFVQLSGSKYTSEGTTTFEFDDTENPQIMTRDCIEGMNGTDIDFKINFKAVSKPEYALIRVEYHNYTCYHLIFVRMGYDADDTFGDGNYWMATNNISKDEVGEDPRDEGSLFKFGSWEGIPSEINVNHKDLNQWVKITPNDFTNNALNNTSFTSSAGNQTTFAGIAMNSNGFENPSGMKVASYDDFFGKLSPEDADNQHFKVKTGVGVLYADGATETATTLEDAYGYKRGGEKKKGMRGVFAYDVTNGKNLFFPIGSSGYGHRKNEAYTGKKNWGGNVIHTGTTLTGLLRYSMASRWGYFDAVGGTYPQGVYDAPLFLDIFRAQGAIYYLNMKLNTNSGKPTDNQPFAWDMNYVTLDFGPIMTQDLDWGKDACFVRCIKE